MWGACLARYAAMAAFSVSGYEPLKIALTSYSLWEALNFAAISPTRSPSVACSACHQVISVLASAGPGRTATRAAPTSTAVSTVRGVHDDMRVLLCSTEGATGRTIAQPIVTAR